MCPKYVGVYIYADIWCHYQKKEWNENGIVAKKNQILQIYILTKYEHLTILLDVPWHVYKHY